MNNNKPSEVIVIGGGASGMMAAISAARNGAKVTILEHSDRIGKKILSTGNGKCNFTNSNQDPDNYHGENPGFVVEILKQADYFFTLKLFAQLGIHAKNKNGYVYPNSLQASSVLDVLRFELARLNVNIFCNVHISKIVKNVSGFHIYAFNNEFECDNLIICTGSKAAPVTGSDGSGYKYAIDFGHKIIKVLPGLVQLKSKAGYFKSIAGVRVDAELKLVVDNTVLLTEKGELQITNYGLSGIPIFQLSRFAAKALDAKKKVNIIINFLPEFKIDSLIKFLKQRLSNSGNKTLEESLIGLLNKKLIVVLVKEAGLSLNTRANTLNDSQIKRLANEINAFVVNIFATNSFENAQVCCGGISTDEINNTTLESKLIKGLYFAGEIIDIDGNCGGYNLQWAWSSGYVAGKNAAIKQPVFNLN